MAEQVSLVKDIITQIGFFNAIHERDIEPIC